MLKIRAGYFLHLVCNLRGGGSAVAFDPQLV